MDANTSLVRGRVACPIFLVAISAVMLSACGGSSVAGADDWRARAIIAEEIVARDDLCGMMGDVTPQQYLSAKRDAQAAADALVTLAQEDPDRVYRGRTVRTIVSDELSAYVAGCADSSTEIRPTLSAGLDALP